MFIPHDKKSTAAAFGLCPRPLLTVLSFPLLAGALTVEAQQSSVNWIVGGHIGNKTHELEQLLDSKLSFHVASVTARAAYGDAYVAANLSQSFEDADVSEEGETGKASRSDADITVGWNVTPQLTVFAGYKTGETEIDFKVRESVIEDTDDDITPAFTDSFEESGVFVGVAYGWSLGEAGQLGVSLAYADMEAENKLTGTTDEDFDEDDEIDFDDLTGTFNGDVSGYSAAVQWSKPLGDHLVYQALIRYNKYEQEIDDTVQGVQVNFDVDENFYEMSMGLLYVF
ncbi:hypothetical protein [Oceanicoccus sp. KOV_DT_Chl]|uniref:hypothetical protein n=1 Tax=Oceanicoccus sp. KOV_DT_Chl TaxID=1904639 RepID=UPI000C7B0217|nr:hypothetical protein [Oceanicoccus sp. KOV_DT_Chl]